MVIVILGCTLSLPCSGNHTTGSWTPASKTTYPMSRWRAIVRCAVSGQAQGRDLRAQRVHKTVIYIVTAVAELLQRERRNIVCPMEGMESYLLILKSRAQKPQGGTRWLKKTFSTSPITRLCAVCECLEFTSLWFGKTFCEGTDWSWHMFILKEK